ncbi:kinase-like protein [Stereum hirsutum FP-91666 SS1]|uniref:kinase-like protein n=1 Tax=Stereum hirsutum (strain FP-91666) TaxID=721885 RepID=UPI000440B159|nr:kinase-like protein [Stereum hirsutum FP-91666 SS1]EIM87435.1 kinase-like protein [Stereum hirsutum FP-91666 SS1]
MLPPSLPSPNFASIHPRGTRPSGGFASWRLSSMLREVARTRTLLGALFRPHLNVEALAMTVLRPPLRSAVRESVQQLLDSGFHVVGYSAMDATTFQAYLEPAIHDLPLPMVSPLPSDARGLFATCVEQLQSVLEYASARPSPLGPDKILVVSSSSVRSLEPATTMGIATALVAEADELEVKALKRTYTVRSTMVASLTDLATTVSSPTLWRSSDPHSGIKVQNVRVAGMYQFFRVFQDSDHVVTARCINWLTGEDVVVKASIPCGAVRSIVTYEAAVYKQLSSWPNLVPVRWSGKTGNTDVLVMDCIGPNLDDLRRACRGKLSLRSVLMTGISLLHFVEFAHSRGVILRDIKPHNFAVGGVPKEASRIYAFDFGLATMYVNPVSGQHIPLRTGRDLRGTWRYCSHWTHKGIEPSRRDDIVALGHTLLELLHGQLPWQGISAPSVEAKVERMGLMKTPGYPAFSDLLAQSPRALEKWMAHAYGLEFEQKPDYRYLLALLEDQLAANGWENDGSFDWVKPELASKGTLFPPEYRFIVDPNAVPDTKRAVERLV